MHYETQYLGIMKKILTRGEDRGDRTGVGTRSLFSPGQIDVDLNDAFPILQTKRVYWKGVVEELLWMLRGETNSKTLAEKNVHIWDDWGNQSTGDLGPIYGAQWRGDGNTPDQIKNLVESLRTDPNGRRHIVCAWQPRDLHLMALPPCHCFFQMYVSKRGLECHLYQRSVDILLGSPFNLASYSLLTEIMAKVIGVKAYRFVYSMGDAHIYHNHLVQCSTQLARDTPTSIPKLIVKRIRQYPWEYEFEDFELIDYKPLPAIKAPIAV